MNCKQCILDDLFWNQLDSIVENERTLIKLYYNHKLDILCLQNKLKLCDINAYDASKVLLNIIDKYSCCDIIDIIRKDFEPYELKAKDIPQFSNFEIAYHKIISLLIDSGLESVSYDRMGYFLRTDPRKAIADRKYGENHSKMACLMGLCYMRNGGHVIVHPFGQVFNSLSIEQQERLKPKLCLYIPLIQSYFVNNCDSEFLNRTLSILSESTIIRRTPNIKYLINIVKNAIDHELYGSQHQ